MKKVKLHKNKTETNSEAPTKRQKNKSIITEEEKSHIDKLSIQDDNPVRQDNKKRKRTKKMQDDRIPENDPANDEEEIPKKKSKKKKKTEDNAEGVAESKMSKRALKREKHAQRLAEAEAASHKAVQMQALSYLSLWKFNRAEWKFNKVKQIWLFKNKFDTNKIPEELWQAFIEYFMASSGSIKKLIVDDCQSVIEEMEKWIEKNADTENPKDKPSNVIYKRARDLLQNING